ncbi:hypothetical protein SD457_21520 [Coprobacillaceae bacterium CR2/5/TPMF4]|nr:hypothetical protein SD457_21520 [Coprobacillaceae bacterium CR2/5/TPMF4]
MVIFNITPAIVSFIAGAAIAMEEKFKKQKIMVKKLTKSQLMQ